MTGLTIRPESRNEYGAIHDLTQRAFAPMPFAAGDEQTLIGLLRDAGALSLSLVAEQAGVVVGHVAFTPATAANGAPGWYALGPVSVEPALQRAGIGSRLINAGLNTLRAWDAAGCILTGNPAYYRRFGFVVTPQLCPPEETPAYFMVLPMRVASPASVISFHPLFHASP